MSIPLHRPRLDLHLTPNVCNIAVAHGGLGMVVESRSKWRGSINAALDGKRASSGSGGYSVTCR